MAPQIDKTTDAQRATATLDFMKIQSQGHRGIVRPVAVHADLALNDLASAYWFLYFRKGAEERVEDWTPWYVVLTPEQDADLFPSGDQPAYFSAITHRMREYARREGLACISNALFDTMRDIEIRELERVAKEHQTMFELAFGAPGDDGLLRQIFTGITACDTTDAELPPDTANKAIAFMRRRPQVGMRILIHLAEQLAAMGDHLAEETTPDALMRVELHLQISRPLTPEEVAEARTHLRRTFAGHMARFQGGSNAGQITVDQPTADSTE